MDIIDFYNAVSKGDFDKVKEFENEHNGSMPLNKNVTVNFTGTSVLPLPLIVAFQKRHFEIAKYFIQKGADINLICKRHNKTPKDFMPEGFKL